VRLIMLLQTPLSVPPPLPVVPPEQLLAVLPVAPRQLDTAH